MKKRSFYALGLLLSSGMSISAESMVSMPNPQEHNVAGSSPVSLPGMAATGFAEVPTDVAGQSDLVDAPRPWGALEPEGPIVPPKGVHFGTVHSVRPLEGPVPAREAMPQWVRQQRFAPVTSFQKQVTDVIYQHKGLDAFKALIKPGYDVNKPFGEYTLLMMSSQQPALAKYLIEECKADVNESVWQPGWGHYVTALDCCESWDPTKHTTKENADRAAAQAYLISKGAKKSGDLTAGAFLKGVNKKDRGLNFWDAYFGDYVLSSQIAEVLTILLERKIHDQGPVVHAPKPWSEIPFYGHPYGHGLVEHPHPDPVDRNYPVEGFPAPIPHGYGDELEELYAK